MVIASEPLSTAVTSPMNSRVAAAAAVLVLSECRVTPVPPTRVIAWVADALVPQDETERGANLATHDFSHDGRRGCGGYVAGCAGGHADQRVHTLSSGEGGCFVASSNDGDTGGFRAKVGDSSSKIEAMVSYLRQSWLETTVARTMPTFLVS